MDTGKWTIRAKEIVKKNTDEIVLVSIDPVPSRDLVVFNVHVVTIKCV